MTDFIDQPLIGRDDHFVKLQAIVEKYGIVNLVESGTGPHSSGLEAAKRLGLRGFSCDVYKPCVERAVALYPEFQHNVYWAASVDMLDLVLPSLNDEPTFFWLDGHCPTDQACLPGGVFPVWEEFSLIRKLKAGYERDVIWCDDVSMIAMPDNPVAGTWSGFLGGIGQNWYGEHSHMFREYLEFFADTHTWTLEGALLRLEPR